MSRGVDGIYRVSNSELRTFKRCPRKWWIAYYRRREPRGEELVGPRSIGTRVHFALATYYSGTFDPDEALRTYKEISEEDRNRFFERDPLGDAGKLNSEIDLGRIMLEGYFDWLAETGADWGLNVVAAETPIEAPLAGFENVNIRGKLDLRLQREFDGARLFLDHKTVGSLQQANGTIIQDEQMLTYHLLEKLEAYAIGDESGERTDGGLYSMLRKVKRTAAAKPPFYDRIEVRHNDEELRNFYIRITGQVSRILEAETALGLGTNHQYVVPPNPTRDCSWDCDFYRLCPMFDDGSRAEDFLRDNFVVADPDARYVANDQKDGER
jgi:hypothetical protein